MIARRTPPGRRAVDRRGAEVERGERGVWVAAAAISAALVWWYAALFLSPVEGLVVAQPGPTAVLEARPLAPVDATTASPLGPLVGPRIDDVVRTDEVTSPVRAGAVIDVASADGVSARERAELAVRVALQQIGLPYVWGGNGPENGHRGFDCSGLTTFSYAKAGVALPRTAHTQFRHGPRVPAGTELQPGDLVFYGTYAKVHHVGMYIGQGRMVNAPTFGQPVQTAWFRWAGDDYIGATRPATTGTGAVSRPDPAVPEFPDPRIPDEPVFRAPPAPPLPAPATALSLPAAPNGPVPTLTPAAGPAGPADDVARPGPPTTTASAPVPLLPAITATPSPTTVPTTPAGAPPAAPTTPPPPDPGRDEVELSTAPPPPAWVAGRRPSGVVDSGSLIGLAAVDRGGDGLPAQPGVWFSEQQVLIRLTQPLRTAAADGKLVLRFTDGTSTPVTITETRTSTTAKAAAITAPLTILTPAGAGHWQVTTATPATQTPPTAPPSTGR